MRLLRNFSTLLIVSVLLILFSVKQAHCYPYRAILHGDKSEVIKIASSLKDGIRVSSSSIKGLSKKVIRLSTYVPGAGRFNILLDEVQYKSWDSKISLASGISKKDEKDIILVDGIAKRSGKRIPVGGSIYAVNGKPTLHLIFNSVRTTGRALYLKGRISSNKLLEVKVSSVPQSAVRALACGDKDEKHTLSPIQNSDTSSSVLDSSDAASLTPLASKSMQVAIISTDADPEYYAAYGADTNAHIATLVSAASAIYREQLGVKLQLGVQNVFTSQSGNPYTTANPYNLLPAFKDYTLANNHLGNATAYHLFSGKDFDGAVIGLAWMGVVCSSQDYAFGITQKFYPSSDASVLAHELGHNFGAAHDNSDSTSIMAPYVSIPGSARFSQHSIDEIHSHLQSAPTCMNSTDDNSPEVTPTPTPTPEPTDPTGFVPTPTPTQIPNPLAPNISMSASITKSGVLTLTFRVDQLKDGCTINLIGSTRRNVDGSLIASISPSSTLTVLRLAGLKGTKTNQYLSFSAEYSCTEDSSFSDKFCNINLRSIAQKSRVNSNQTLTAIGRAISNAQRSKKG